MADDAMIRRANLIRLGKTPAELTISAGSTPAYWSNLMRDANKSFGEKAARRIEDALLLPRGWLDEPHDEDTPAPNPASKGVAHRMSLHRIETVPSMTLEQITMRESKELPATFRMPIENGEMSPRVKPGAWVQFSSVLAGEARPGDGVLVKDATGGIHFRVYRAGRPGVWEAHSESPDYETLFSDRDGLQVVAVLTAVEGRWS